MLQYEVARKQLLDKQQKKIEAMEARAAELQAEKAEHERQWAVAQRERELQKVYTLLGDQRAVTAAIQCSVWIVALHSGIIISNSVRTLLLSCSCC